VHTDGGGYAATYITIKEEARQRVRKNTPKKPGKEKEATMPKKPGEEPKKEPKDLSHIECFRCKQHGHYSTSRVCPMHPKNLAKM
jgi:hypothetical protein